MYSCAGMEAYESNLEKRREKLRELLVREEAELVRELVEKTRKLEDQRAAKLEAEAAEAAAEIEANKLDLLHEKLLQRYVESNAELRENLKRAWARDAKRVNRVQIAEAEQRRRYPCNFHFIETLLFLLYITKILIKC